MENTVENMNENESIKVLVVDDEQDIRTLLNIYLKRLGYEVVEAADGVEAVETVRANSDIDLIVMDIMMPKQTDTPLDATGSQHDAQSCISASYPGDTL